METVMKLPIQDRRYYIQRHNEEQDGLRKKYEKEKNGKTKTYDGEALNAFARNEQENIKNMSKRG